MENVTVEQAIHASRFTGELDPALGSILEAMVDEAAPISVIHDTIVSELVQYRENSGIDTVVIGLSGGVDSAVTAKLFQHARWNVLPYTLPIDQRVEETTRAKVTATLLGRVLPEIDLTDEYVALRDKLSKTGPLTAIQLGNIRARLRMTTLYNEAARHGGIVASTDNFSELAAGFWTLHGDVGDIAPLQYLNKSWEVPLLAKYIGFPESIWRATPTDGLGISNSDEDQLGCSYLEWDIGVSELIAASMEGGEPIDHPLIRDVILPRVRRTAFKRRQQNVFGQSVIGDRLGLSLVDVLWS